MHRATIIEISTEICLGVDGSKEGDRLQETESDRRDGKPEREKFTLDPHGLA